MKINNCLCGKQKLLLDANKIVQVIREPENNAMELSISEIAQIFKVGPGKESREDI